MVKLHRFPAKIPASTEPTHDGAACISYYDPYTPRTLFCLHVVDYTNGILMGASPPKIEYRELEMVGNRFLEVRAGFDPLPGRIMDRENIHISSAEVALVNAEGITVAQERVEGQWYAGTFAFAFGRKSI